MALLAIVLLLAVGCTQEPDRDLRDVDIGAGGDGSATGSSESPAASPSPLPVGEVPTDAGRLLVLDAPGNLVTLAPDGSDAVMLAEAVQGETFAQQPTWSPDGARVAWVRVDVSEGEATAVLVTSRADGRRPTETQTAVVPFYLFWDPTASRVAYLGTSDASGIELGIAEVGEEDAEGVPIDGGSPFYFSWHPAGEQMVIHVGGERLERLAVDGEITEIGDRPGTFDAPVWAPDGRIVFASTSDAGQRLVVHDLEEERSSELVGFDGAITFVVSPDGRRIAFQVYASQTEIGPLSIIDRRTGEIDQVTADVAPAYFWSPAGDRLLYLLPEVEPEGTWFRWGVWGREAAFTTPRFLPSEVFARQYLQFFEQYAQSMTLWAPDGSAFVYAGVSEAGEEGIWIQPVRSGVGPILVGDGVFASWSPS
jgi:TolB protein